MLPKQQVPVGHALGAPTITKQAPRPWKEGCSGPGTVLLCLPEVFLPAYLCSGHCPYLDPAFWDTLPAPKCLFF